MFVQPAVKPHWPEHGGAFILTSSHLSSHSQGTIFGVVDFLRIMEALTRGRLNATDVLKDNRNLQLWMFSARHRVIKDQGKLRVNVPKFSQDLLCEFKN